MIIQLTTTFVHTCDVHHLVTHCLKLADGQVMGPDEPDETPNGHACHINIIENGLPLV